MPSLWSSETWAVVLVVTVTTAGLSEATMSANEPAGRMVATAAAGDALAFCVGQPAARASVTVAIAAPPSARVRIWRERVELDGMTGFRAR